MAKKNDRDSLGYLGIDFQYKLVKAFMEDSKFFRGINSIVNQNMFTDPNLRVYMGVFKEYFEKYDLVPSYQMMGIELNSKAHDNMDREFLTATLDKIKETSSEGTESIREKADKFFKQQNIVKVANEILKIAADGDISKYPDCATLIQKAMEIGDDDDLGINPYDNMEEVLSDEYRITIPTGVGKVDETLEGGLGKGELGIIIGSSSFGKVQPFDAKIVTPTGYKNMGDIKVGDYVMGKNGMPTKVIGVYPHKDWDFYRVNFSDNVSTECGKEHLWSVNSLYQRCGRKYVKGTGKNGKKIYKPDHSFKTLSLSEIMEKGLHRKFDNRCKFKIPMCEPVNFQEINVDVNPYLMGYLISDRCFSRNSISIGVSDIDEVLALLKKCDENVEYNTNLCKNRNIWSVTPLVPFKYKWQKYYNPSLKSENKYIHDDYLYNSIVNRIALLNGLMDSDGTVQKNGCSCFNSKSKQLAEDVKQLVLSLGGFASISSKKRGYYSKKYDKYVDCGIHYEVVITLVDTKIPIFRLKRKQERVRYRTVKCGDRFMNNIEFSRTCDGQCIKVDAEDELYLTDDFIVTHNTSLTTAMACHAATCKTDKNNEQGFKVLQIIFEDRPKQIQRKYFGRISGIEAKDLSKPDYIEQVKKSITEFEDRELLKNNVRIKRYPSGEVTATQIKSFIKKQINAGFYPDVVIIDYFECVKLEKSHDASDSEWTKEGFTMRKFESMAGELNIAIWIPTQGTKDSLNAEIVTMDKAGGSFKKIQIGHIVMSIARTMEDIAKCLATIAVLKNRAGSAGKVYNNVEFNNGTCRISTDNVDEFESMSEFNSVRSESQKKDMFNTAKDILSKNTANKH